MIQALKHIPRVRSLIRAGIRRRRAVTAVFLTTTLAAGLLQGLLVWALREVLISFGKHNEHVLAVSASALLILVLWVMRAACTGAGEVFSARLAHGIEVDSMTRILERILVLPVRFFDKSSQGDLVLTTYSDAQQIRSLMLNLGNVVLHVTRLLGLGAVAWIMSPKLAAIGLVAVPIGAWPALLLGERIQTAARKGRGAVRSLYESFLQVSAGIRVIKVNTSEARVIAQAKQVGQAFFGHLVGQANARSLARFLLESVSGLGLIAVLVIGGRDVARGTLEWQSLLSLLVAIMGVYAPTIGILQVYVGIQTALPFLQRIEGVLEREPEIHDIANARALTGAPHTIEFRDVTFAYDDQIVLDRISATFYRGETIGIVGPSGAGKSTLISMLLRLYDPKGGQILFDGVDLREFRQSDLMRQCAIVMQEPFLFLDTIANNILAARPNATREEIIEAAEAANIHDEIMAMDQGYDTLLGRAEQARGISTGQKQRISIAAALLKNAPILFLDEATSSLDSVSERKLQSALDRLMHGRTTFVIAHRLSTLRSADRILVLDNGRLVGLGTHEELIASCETYHRLWTYQMGPADLEMRDEIAPSVPAPELVV